MATYNSILKNDVFLTVEEVAEWLKIKPEQIEVPESGEYASVEIQDIKYRAKTIGTDGNQLSIEYLDDTTSGSENVSLDGNKIIVHIESGVTTAVTIKGIIEGHAVNSLVELSYIIPEGSDEPTVSVKVQVANANTPLSGGVNDVPFEKGVEERRKLVERLINASCSKAVSILDRPILIKDWIEIVEINNTNVFVPKYPPVEVVEVRVDVDRGFGDDSIVSSDEYFISEGAIKFKSCVLGAAKIIYRTGFGEIEDILDDIKHATTLLVQYYYKQKENGELGMMSKSVRGETFMKFSTGIPEDIMELFEPHVDYGFGTPSPMQRNNLGT